MAIKLFPRQGAFCVLNKKVGVIFEYPQINSAGEGGVDTIDTRSAEVHFMNDKGETAEKVRNVPVDALSQARLSQIPAKRRPAAAAAKRYGYE